MEHYLGVAKEEGLSAEEMLDDGALLRVAIEFPESEGVHGRSVSFDFTGSAPVHSGNLNATPGIVRSAVLYVLRLLIGGSIPLNEGLLDGVDLIVPRGILNPDFSVPPEQAPAVVGGNVETSQRLVDTLLKAFGEAGVDLPQPAHQGALEIAAAVIDHLHHPRWRGFPGTGGDQQQ